MVLFKKSIVILLFISLSLSACGKDSSTQVSIIEPEGVVPTEKTEAVLPTQTSQPETNGDPTLSPDTNPYADCGPGGLMDIGYYFKDNNGNISPTQLERIQKTSDDVRDYVEISTCLKFDEGWISNPDEVVNGYENEVIFYDKNAVAHTYRIIIGGHYVEPYEPSHKDITASLDGVDNILFFDVQDWISATHDFFVTNGSRQIGLAIYIDDNQGDLSKVLTQVYSFRDTNLQIFQALQTGEGYPDQVPEGYFLFATNSWLTQPD